MVSSSLQLAPRIEEVFGTEQIRWGRPPSTDTLYMAFSAKKPSHRLSGEKNGVSAAGVLFLGVLGSPFIGYQQDQDMRQRLAKEHGTLLAQVAGPVKPSIFGETPSLDQEKIKALDAAASKELTTVQADSKRGAFANIAVLPAFMLLCYLGMWLYYRSKGGYKPVDLGGH